MTEEQKSLLSQIPKRDRGLHMEDDDDQAPNLIKVCDDPVEAAQKKFELEQEQKMKKLKRKEAALDKNYIS